MSDTPLKDPEEWAAAIELACEGGGDLRAALADMLDKQAAANRYEGAAYSHPDYAECYYDRAKNLRAAAERIRGRQE